LVDIVSGAACSPGGLRPECLSCCPWKVKTVIKQKEMIMKCKTSAVLFAVSFILFLIELFFKIDLMVLLFSYHETFLDAMLPVFIFTGIGFAVDYVLHLLKRKESEKNQLYQETVFGMNHLVRSLQSKFIMITESEAVKKELGCDLIELLRESSEDIEKILDKLTDLNKADSETVKEILDSPNHCHICGCEIKASKRATHCAHCKKIGCPIREAQQTQEGAESVSFSR
jgi:predicted Zn-ribbon and HTH transcriptional regulator